jgi:hypothetical protein
MDFFKRAAIEVWPWMLLMLFLAWGVVGFVAS